LILVVIRVPLIGALIPDKAGFQIPRRGLPAALLAMVGIAITTLLALLLGGTRTRLSDVKWLVATVGHRGTAPAGSRFV
jgi:hypothetical protein